MPTGDVEKSYRSALDNTLSKQIADPGSLLLSELLAREAHVLIHGKPAPDNPYALLARARVLAHTARKADFDEAQSAAMAARPGDPEVLAAKSRILAEKERIRPATPAVNGRIPPSPSPRGTGPE